MIFHKYKLVVVGIPKNASSSIYDTLKNNTDNAHNHDNIFDIFNHNDHELLDTYANLAVVRNPYDRFISACFQVRRHEEEDGVSVNKSYDDIIDQYIKGTGDGGMFFKQQYTYVCFGSKILVDNILRFETLQEDWTKFIEKHNETSQFKARKNLSYSNTTPNRDKWEREIKRMSKENLDYINHFYHRDFELFGYEKLKV